MPHRINVSRSPLALLTLIAGLLAPGLVSAQTIHVDRIRGPRGSTARRAVVEAVREVDGVTVAEGDADLRVTGRVTGRRSRARVALRVRDDSGRTLARRTLRMRDRDVFQDGASALVRRAQRRLRARAERSDEAPARSRSSSSSSSAAPAEGEETGLRPIVEVLAGARLAGRLAAITMRDGNVHRNAVPYPELTLAAIVRPWRDATGIERGLVFRGNFGHAVGLRSRNTLTDEPVGTTFFRAYGEIGMLFDPDPNVEVGLGVGFGFDGFLFEQQALTVIPSAEYPYIRPNLRGRFRIERELLVLDIAAGYRGVLARGALSEHFGEEGQTQGFDLIARLGGSLDLGFAYGFEAGLVSYFHFFDGDAVTASGQEGTDISLWLGAHVGFAIR